MPLLTLLLCGVALAGPLDFDLAPGRGDMLRLPTGPFGDRAILALVLDGEPCVLDLERVSLRSPDFQIELRGETTVVLADRDLPRPRTYRGDLLGSESGERIGFASATHHLEGSWSIVIRTQTTTHAIQPLPGSAAFEHLLYQQQDIVAPEALCASRDGLTLASDSSLEIPAQDRLGEEGIHLTEIAFDADYPYFLRNGSSALRVLQDIELVLNGVDAIFRRDVAIGYELTRVIVRTSEAQDPYTSDVAGVLLNEFQDHWNAHHQNVVRDIAHLMTDRRTGGTLGVARLGVICRLEKAYALSRSRWSENLVLRVQLTAHELGHNWRAQHCNSDPDCSIMCSSIGACDRSDQFESRSIQDISAHRDSRSCLDFVSSPKPFPWFEPFADSQWDSSMWTYHRGVELLERDGAPSADGIARLEATRRDGVLADDLRSQRVDLRESVDPFLTFFARPGRGSSGGLLRVEAFHPDLLWRPLLVLPHDGNPRTEFSFHRLAIPEGLRWQQFRLRFVTVPSPSPHPSKASRLADDWEIDDLQLRDGGVSHTVSPLVRGHASRLRAQGATPGHVALFFVALDGLGSGPCFGETCLDLLWPVYLLGAQVADHEGEASMIVVVPDTVPPMPVYAQALVTDSNHFVTSHPVITEIQ